MIVTLGNPKGGVGKSTIATNLAVLFADTGYRVVLLDADPQASAAIWAGERSESDRQPSIPCFQRTGRIQGALRELASSYDIVLVDTGGRDSAEFRAALVVSQLVLAPIRPTQFDVWAISPLSRALEEAHAVNEGLSVMLVPNATPTHPGMNDSAQARDVIRATLPDYRVSSSEIRHRAAYHRCVEAGLAVHESSPADPKASAEMRALFDEILQEITE